MIDDRLPCFDAELKSIPGAATTLTVTLAVAVTCALGSETQRITAIIASGSDLVLLFRIAILKYWPA